LIAAKPGSGHDGLARWNRVLTQTVRPGIKEIEKLRSIVQKLELKMHKYLFGLMATCLLAPTLALGEDIVATDAAKAAAMEAQFISDARQSTFDGLRAGEGYFSSDGRSMVFQAERFPTNPFYQIFRMDLDTGDLTQVSPGDGKTTCAWIHPDGDRVLFASTHHDPEAVAKQKAELEFRASGKQRRYAWDYDPQYELYSKSMMTGETTRLSHALGYDAEGSYSPDGKTILFASNRVAYERKLTEKEQTLFDIDPASMIDIYRMDADGGNVVRLTNSLGYDGGPFFSPDGKRFCWRRFSEDGATAEIHTMGIDGSDARQLTHLGAMSWAPFYHPSGEYLIFTTNRHGFANFELYLVRADGKGEPVRVSFTDGFDGLPVFLPDGNSLSWTSNRGATKKSQIFMAKWNHDAARQALKLDSASSTEFDSTEDRDAALASAQSSIPSFTPADVGRHVDYLTRPELGGRLTGTEGERRATAYVAAYLESLGFEPAGENGSFFHEFEFPAGAEFGEGNKLAVSIGDTTTELTLDESWQPLSFSGNGPFESAPVVFAGYGLVAPATESIPEYDSYVHLDVTDKWVVVFRDLPQDIKPELRQHWARYSAPRRKASVARDLGARGIIFVAGPTSGVKQELIRFDRDASQAGVSMAVISIDNATAEKWFTAAGKSLADEQKGFDNGEMAMGEELATITLSGVVNIKRNTGTGRNVLARLRCVDARRARESASVVIVGAHIDHLGVGGGGSSLAKDDEREKVHVGADDNASGVGAMLEIAQYLAAEKRNGKLDAKRDLIIAAWSGEELGLFGSQAFVKDFYTKLYPNAPKPQLDEAAQAHAAMLAAHGAAAEDEPLTMAVAAYLNLDMVGRLREKLVIQGIGSSPIWEGEVQRRNVPIGLQLELDKTATRLPTDAASLVSRNVPILAAFTGAHEDYHTPRDTPEKLNYDGAAKIANLFGLIARGLLLADTAPEFKLEEGAQESETPRANLTAYLGSIPDYVAGDIKGLKLSGVAADGPAAKAGVKGGDVIIELAGRKIENIYDYTYAIEALKIGEPVKMVVTRGTENLEMQITPASRD
jgi:Tol biopolymer transport system component